MTNCVNGVHKYINSIILVQHIHNNSTIILENVSKFHIMSSIFSYSRIMRYIAMKMLKSKLDFFTLQKYIVIYLFNEHQNKKNFSTITFFFWACQFTIDPYVKMFHINKYHLTKKNSPCLEKM